MFLQAIDRDTLNVWLADGRTGELTERKFGKIPNKNYSSSNNYNNKNDDINNSNINNYHNN